MMEGQFQTLFYYHVLLLTLFFFSVAAGRIRGLFHRLFLLTASYLALLTLGMFSSSAILVGSWAWMATCAWGFILVFRQHGRPLRWPSDRIRELTPALLLFAFSSAYWLYVLRDTAGLPSRDDGTFHLFYFTRMLDTGEVFTGRIPFLYSEFFGARNQSFYPTGSHFLASVVLSPLRIVFDISNFLQLKLFLIFSLSIFPSLMYLGCRKHFPEFGRGAVFLAAIGLLSISVYPFNPLGEGGFSRIIGLALSTPFVWFFLQSGQAGHEARRPFWEKISLASLTFPILFFVHPSALFIPLTAVIVSFFRGTNLFKTPFRSWLLYGACATFSALFCVLILRTGDQIVTQGFVLEIPPELSRLSWLSVFERLKSPFHYAFGDGLGFGKFFSPRSLLAYLGIWVIFRSYPSLRTFWLAIFFLPFILAALIFFPWGGSKVISVLFYHSVRRMAELVYFPLFLAWVAGLSFLAVKSKWIQAVAVVLLVCVTAIGAVKGAQFMAARDAEFHTLKTSELNQVIETVLRQPPAPQLEIVCQKLPSQVLIAMDSIKTHFKWILWTLECNPENLGSPHCQKRKAAIERIVAGAAQSSTPGTRQIELPWESCVSAATMTK